jgi:hypothetical protein
MRQMPDEVKYSKRKGTPEPKKRLFHEKHTHIPEKTRFMELSYTLVYQAFHHHKFF